MFNFGKNFLKNKNILKKIAKAIKIENGDYIFEIGAGHGELTKEIIKLAKNKKVKIFCIEKDKKLFKELKSNFKNKNLRLINQNVLKLIPRINNFLPSNKDCNLKIVGNIPYYITGKILRQISDLEEKPKLCIFTIQKEVGERIISITPKLNKLSAIIHFWAKPEIILNISRKNFYPQPKVDSVLLKLQPTQTKYLIEYKKYYQTVNTLFKQPRKTILNNLLLAFKSKVYIISLLKKLNINPNSRPQNLSIEQIIEIAKKI